MQSAWLYHATGVPLAQLDLNRMAQQISAQQTDQQANKNTSRRIVYNSAKRPIDVYDSNNQHIASYAYNGQGERIAKTVYGGSISSTSYSLYSYSLYSEQRLAAETDSEGHITAHYVYLYGKPIAKIEMQKNTQTSHQFWKTITSLGGLIKQTEIDASDDRNVIYADGTVVRQRKATSGTMSYADTVKYITYKANPLTFDLISGTVDAKAYIQWLKANGYNINVTAQ